MPSAKCTPRQGRRGSEADKLGHWWPLAVRAQTPALCTPPFRCRYGCWSRLALCTRTRSTDIGAALHTRGRWSASGRLFQTPDLGYTVLHLRRCGWRKPCRFVLGIAWRNRTAHKGRRRDYLRGCMGGSRRNRGCIRCTQHKYDRTSRWTAQWQTHPPLDTVSGFYTRDLT